MKKVLSFVFFPCFAIVVNLKIAYPNAYFLSQPPKKTIPVPPQQPNFERSSVGLYKYLPQTGDNIKKNYLRFTMSGKMYNHWLLLLKEMTAKPTPAARLRFYKLWTGIMPLESAWYRYLWTPAVETLQQIYQYFDNLYHPHHFGLQTILKDFLTSENGFLKFYLTFVGQYRANNFFPMGAGYSEYMLQSACRRQGCSFQFPIIPDSTFIDSYDIGPTVNIFPDTSKNTYLKNFWRYVVIQEGAIVKNTWPLVIVAATSALGADIRVRQVLEEIIIGIATIFNIVRMSWPHITIPNQYYDLIIPHYNPQEHGATHLLEIGFDYWVSRLATSPYQNQLKIELGYKQPEKQLPTILMKGSQVFA